MITSVEVDEDKGTGFVHCGLCHRDHSSMDLNGRSCKNPELQKKPVLLVEDDADVAELIAEVVEKMRLYIVMKARGVEDAKALFGADKFFAVLLDLGLAGSTENGIKLAQHLRMVDDNVFIAVVTGHYPIFDARLIESVDDIISKPVHVDVLQTKLFMWSIKYNRRLALKQYVDERAIKYQRELDDIRKMGVELKTKASVLATQLGMHQPVDKELYGDSPNG